ncbi:hypothetical protein JTM38_34050, partial [Pseudomonas aeruginosa]|nr:hypothetical protein [Pseudomonas aeruginosa]
EDGRLVPALKGERLLAALADLGGANGTGPDGCTDLEAGEERLAVLDAAVHLEGLLWDTPAAALGSAGGGQQAVDHAFQGEALGAVPFRVSRCVEDFPRFLIDLKAPC